MKRRDARRGDGSPRTGVLSLAAAVALAVAALAVASSSDVPSPLSPEAAAASPARPNVLVVESDDQTLESMRVMDNVRSLIGERGATFANSFTNWALCCPSRATFVTGQYAHNHDVLGNAPPGGGFERFQSLHGNNNLAVWLQDAGYHTAMIGKYLNGYAGDQPTLVPAGWSEWVAAPGPTTQWVYNYQLNENGTLVDYGADPDDFKQDVLTDTAVDFIDRRAPARKPFFLWLTYTAPHGSGENPDPNPPGNCTDTAKPAPRHAHAFDSEPLPQPPNFNEVDVSDKPVAIQERPLLDGPRIAEVTRKYRCRIESILSVDEGVRSLVEELRQHDELGDTLILYTSDNGFHHGEHRIPSSKNRVYEESIRVPLLMRGPGIPRGVTVRDLATNADLAPTIVDAGEATPGLVMDGRSLLPLAKHPTVERGRELEVETNQYAAIRTHRYVYVEHATGETELYDLKDDPFELQSRHADPAYTQVRAGLAERLQDLESCFGRNCRLKPDLALRLDYRKGHENGHRCARGAVHAKLRGADADELVEGEFYVDGDLVKTDRSAPFRARLPGRLLDGRTRLRARGTLLDGRRMTIDRKIRACD